MTIWASLIFERALDLLTASRNMGTHARLSTCAGRVLFLVGIAPTHSTWQNFSLKEALRRYEGRIIERALKDAYGRVTRAAHLLGFNHHGSLITLINSHHRELLSARKPITKRRRSLIFLNNKDKKTRHPTIMHVEDHELVAAAVKETLEIEGWTVETFLEGTAALHTLRSKARYDVLILGNEMPGMSGVELIRETRRIPRRRKMPIIMLSASDVEKETRRAGANAFLRKPEDITVIAETIARLLACKPKQTIKG